MAAKLAAARIATDSGSDMVIANGDEVEVVYRILNGENGEPYLPPIQIRILI